MQMIDKRIISCVVLEKRDSLNQNGGVKRYSNSRVSYYL